MQDAVVGELDAARVDRDQAQAAHRRLLDAGADPVANAIAFARFSDGSFGWNVVDPGHGLVFATTQRPLDAAAAAPLSASGTYGPLLDASGARTFEIRIVRATPKGVVARLAGIGDRNAAEALKGVELYIARDRLPASAEGEFYHADLIGLAAVDPEGKPIGRVVTVQNYGAGDLLEIRLAGSGKTEFVPFTEATVPEVDIAAGRVVVVIPAASGDDEEEEAAKDDAGYGMVGSVTFALFGEATSALTPIEVYALHCCWELEMNHDPRAPEKRSVKAGMALLQKHNPRLGG